MCWGANNGKEELNPFETIEEKHERALKIVDQLRRIVDSRWQFALQLLQELEDILKEPY